MGWLRQDTRPPLATRTRLAGLTHAPATYNHHRRRSISTTPRDGIASPESDEFLPDWDGRVREGHGSSAQAAVVLVQRVTVWIVFGCPSLRWPDASLGLP